MLLPNTLSWFAFAFQETNLSLNETRHHYASCTKMPRSVRSDASVHMTISALHVHQRKLSPATRGAHQVSLCTSIMPGLTVTRSGSSAVMFHAAAIVLLCQHCLTKQDSAQAVMQSLAFSWQPSEAWLLIPLTPGQRNYILIFLFIWKICI